MITYIWLILLYLILLAYFMHLLVMYNTSTNSWGCFLKEYTMLNKKFKLLVPITLALATGSAEVNAGLYTSGKSLDDLTVFSNTYTTTGDAAQVYGSMLVGDVVTTGANADVFGNVESVNAANIGGGTSSVGPDVNKGLIGGDVSSGGVMTVGGATGGVLPGPIISGDLTSAGASTIGAYSQVLGNMLSGGIATTGANSVVGGTVDGASISIGATSTVGGVPTTLVTPSGNAVSNTSTLKADIEAKRVIAASEVNAIRATLDGLGAGTVLAATMTVDTTLTAGVYSAPSLSTTASTTLFLDAEGVDNAEFIFNIGDILDIGAYHKIIVLNEGVGKNTSVTWNIGTAVQSLDGGYASIGAQARFIGTVFAQDYVSIGAGAWATTGGHNTCAGIYSETSYVSTGAKAVIDGNVCKTGVINEIVEQVPEPFGLLLSGLAALGFVTHRKTRAARAS
jgi:serine acetyltransferase